MNHKDVGVDKPYLDRSRAIYRGSGKPKVTGIWQGEGGVEGKPQLGVMCVCVY